MTKISEIVAQTFKLFAPPPRDQWPKLEEQKQPEVEVKADAQPDK